MSIKLVAADAHPIFLLGLKQLVSTQSNLELLDCCSSADKVFVKIPGADHNTIFSVGMEAYMAAIKRLVEQTM